MTISKALIRELEYTHRKYLPDDLKRYLLVKYSQEPFPHEYSEQDLYMCIHEDIRDYESGKLDASIKKSSERWKDERDYLQSIYVEKCWEVRGLEEYVAELEAILSEYGLESSRMAERRAEDADLPF